MKTQIRTQLQIAVWLLVFQAIARAAAGTVTSVAAGGLSSFFIQSDGSLWAAGDNSDGQLGAGTFSSPAYRFEEVRTNWAALVACGTQHTLLVNTDGSVGAAGDDLFGDLGDGSTNPEDTFKGLVVAPTGTISIGCGTGHSMFVQAKGLLYGMGENVSGQLGDGTLSNTNRPEPITGGVAKVACSGNATFYLRTNSALWGMGNLNGVIYGLGHRPEPVVSTGVVAVACGPQHALLIKSDGSLWALGSNKGGQLGDGTTNSTSSPESIVPGGVVGVAGGASFSVFCKTDGSLWAMGSNTYGQLGDGTTNRSLLPEQILSAGVIAVAAGQGHSLLLKADGTVWGMGNDVASELGDGFTNAIVATPQLLFPVPPPILNSGCVAKTNLQFSATCLQGGTYCLLSSTNLGLPFSQWTPCATNVIRDRYNNLYSIILTNAVGGGQGPAFFVLQSD